MATKIYLVRHAEAMGNILQTFQGHTDCEISERGEQQLILLRERFKNIGYDCIYSSPLKRTRATAEAINYYKKLPVQLDPGLIEVNGGGFEGKSWDNLPILYPEEYKLWTYDMQNFSAPEGESSVQVFERMISAVGRIARENQNKTVVIASHGFAIRCFLCYANGHNLDYLTELEWADNTAISLVEYDDSFNIRVIYQNNSDHLDSTTSTLANQTWWKEEKLLRESKNYENNGS
jgi:probable phosphoglycerate mutase